MKHIVMLIAALVVFCSPARADDTPVIKAPVVLELYTSQSCSSCPPADKYLQELSRQNNVIALSCHVTYFNYLDWKDTLSQRFCDLRQYSYSGAQGRRGVFTPQMIINGRYGVNGTDRRAVQGAIAQTPVPPAFIKLARDGNHLHYSLPATNGADDTTIYLVEYKAALGQDIGGGENSGKHVEYTNAMQHMEIIGTWDGAAETKTVDVGEPAADTGFAIIAQQHQWGAIVAAGKLGPAQPLPASTDL